MRGERGVALVIVMLLLLMTVLIASEIMERLDLDRARTANVLALEQGYAYLLSAEAMGLRALDADSREDREQSRATDACTEESWARRVGPLPWDQGNFLVAVQDLQARLNLNNLVQSKDGQREIDRAQVERLKRMLRRELPESAAENADALGEEAADWLDSNTLVDGLGGAEDTEYEHWRTGNGWMADVSEMRALRSAQREAWESEDAGAPFSRYITALPEGVRVNVNTAPETVLMSLSDAMDQERAAAIILAREQKPFGRVEDVLALPEIAAMGDAGKNELKSVLVVGSEYFRITAQVVMDGRPLRLESDVFRPRQGGKPKVIRRDLGAAFNPVGEACNADGPSDADARSGRPESAEASP